MAKNLFDDIRNTISGFANTATKFAPQLISSINPALGFAVNTFTNPTFQQKVNQPVLKTISNLPQFNLQAPRQIQQTPILGQVANFGTGVINSAVNQPKVTAQAQLQAYKTPNLRNIAGAVGQTALLGSYALAPEIKLGEGAIAPQIPKLLAKSALNFGLPQGVGSGLAAYGQGASPQDSVKQGVIQGLLATGVGAGAPLIGRGISNSFSKTNEFLNSPEVKLALQNQEGKINFAELLGRGKSPNGKSIHPGDLAEMSDFTSYVNKEFHPTDKFKYEADIRDMAAHYGINPNQSNKRLANEFGKVLDKSGFSNVVNKVRKLVNNEKGGINFGAKVGGGVDNVAQNKAPVNLKNQTINQDVNNILTGANSAKERQFITSVKESAKTPQPVKDIVAGTYLPRSTSELRSAAQKLIKSDPLKAEQLAVNPTSDVHVQIGNELLDHYYATGQFDKATALAESMAQSGTEFGRQVQAFANYDKTTPSGAVRFAQSKVEAFNRANPTKKLKITNTQVQELFDTAKQIQQMPVGRERNIASYQLMDKVNNLIPSSITDKAVTVWKAGLLTSLRTHERNLLGNTVQGSAEIAKDIPSALADFAMSLRTGQRTTSFTFRGIKSGGQAGAQAMKDIISKGYDPEQAINKFDVNHVTWGKNPIEQSLKKVTDAVYRTLGAEDKPFWNAGYAHSLYDQALTEAKNVGKAGDSTFIENLVKNPTDEMKGIALKDANYATFHDTNKLSEIARTIQAIKVGGIPVGQIFAPFVGVPSSIATKIVDYSPLGLIKGIARAGVVVAKDVPALQRQAAQEIGRGVVGTGLFGLGAYLVSKGLMTGQPKDTKEAAQWQLEGKQPNSVLVNGQWRSINSIGPQFLITLAGGKAAEELGKGADSNAGTYAGNLLKDYFSQTFLQGVQGPINAIGDPGRYGGKLVGQTVSSAIPNIVKDVSKATDASQREYNTPLDYIQNSIPGWRNLNVPKRDVLGNIVPQSPTGPAAFIDLFNSRTPIHNPVVDELARLNATGNPATPSTLSKTQTIAGQKATLTPAQLNQLETTVGPQVQQALQQVISSPGYQALPDESKANLLNSIVTKTRTTGKATISLSTPGFQNLKVSGPVKAKKVSTRRLRPKKLKVAKAKKTKTLSFKLKAKKFKLAKVKKLRLPKLT